MSPFFHTPLTADVDSLTILHLKRDSLLPVKLLATADDGYAEGAVTNTRFGSFPHSTLLGLEWGSQVRASKVDTGTRGRKGKKANQESVQEEDTAERTSRKRRSEEQPHGPPASPVKKLKTQEHQKVQQVAKVLPQAGSGFVHILPPTPEAWTSSLDHRTQVVYTPDSSYILQRLRVRPGCRIIEAGAGSGSFTHAAARAVFNGHPDDALQKPGKVYSFEYHEPRVETLQREIFEHGLDGIVQLTHRDVCNEGFSLADPTSTPSADAIFLDLPAPWQALKHLSRSVPNTPLNPDAAVHICTFSPCIEQVTITVSALRAAGWTDITMNEMQHKRIDVRRERVGLREEGLRGVQATAASVEESINRLRSELAQEEKKQSKQERLERIRKEAEERKLYNEGNLATRTEPEVRTHTSYLVFAVLPRDWTEEDESFCAERHPVDEIMKGELKVSDADAMTA